MQQFSRAGERSFLAGFLQVSQGRVKKLIDQLGIEPDDVKGGVQVLRHRHPKEAGERAEGGQVGGVEGGQPPVAPRVILQNSVP